MLAMLEIKQTCIRNYIYNILHFSYILCYKKISITKKLNITNLMWKIKVILNVYLSARLDGVNKPIRPSRTMEEFLQLDNEWEEPGEPTKPGQKRVKTFFFSISCVKISFFITPHHDFIKQIFILNLI